MILPFGKYRGEDILDIPLEYLKWLEQQDWLKEDLRHDIAFEIERRTGDRSSMGRIVPGKINVKKSQS